MLQPTLTPLAPVYAVLAPCDMALFFLAPARKPQLSPDLLGVEGREQPSLMGVSSSPDEVLVGTSVAPALEDNRVLQQLLRALPRAWAFRQGR